MKYTAEQERQANEATAELIASGGTPGQRAMLAAAAQRMGLVRPGEQVLFDGRIHSEVAHRLVAAAVRHGEAIAASRQVNRAKRRADASHRRRAKPPRRRSNE